MTIWNKSWTAKNLSVHLFACHWLSNSCLRSKFINWSNAVVTRSRQNWAIVYCVKNTILRDQVAVNSTSSTTTNWVLVCAYAVTAYNHQPRLAHPIDGVGYVTASLEHAGLCCRLVAEAESEWCLSAVDVLRHWGAAPLPGWTTAQWRSSSARSGFRSSVGECARCRLAVSRHLWRCSARAEAARRGFSAFAGSSRAAARTAAGRETYRPSNNETTALLLHLRSIEHRSRTRKRKKTNSNTINV